MKRLTKSQYEVVAQSIRIQQLGQSIAKDRGSYHLALDNIAKHLANEFAEVDSQFNSQAFFEDCNLAVYENYYKAELQTN
jgi:hypothetical protein